MFGKRLDTIGARPGRVILLSCLGTLSASCGFAIDKLFVRDRKLAVGQAPWNNLIIPLVVPAVLLVSAGQAA